MHRPAIRVLVVTALAAAPAAQERFGDAVVGVGDLDGDGHDEIAVGEPGSGEEGGRVWLLSLGEPTVRASTSGEGLGRALWAPGDLDGDGRGDVVASATADDGGGLLLALGTPELRPLWRVEVPEFDPGRAIRGVGAALCAVGDLDGDGVTDLALGRPFHGGEELLGCVDLISGADGRLLRRIEGERFARMLGVALAAVPDFDGDGLGDLVVSDYAGGVQVHSTGDGARLATVPTPPECPDFGRSLLVRRASGGNARLVVLGSEKSGIQVHGFTLPALEPTENWRLPAQRDHSVRLTRVGGADIALAAAYRGQFGGRRVELLDAASGRPLAALDDGFEVSHDADLYPSNVDPGFGCALAPLGDVDDDEVEEILVGSRGRVGVLSGADLRVLRLLTRPAGE